MSAETPASYLSLWNDLPTDWTLWGPGTIELARQLDRPILLSVGFAASTWCRRMIAEVYSDPDVIGLIDTSFVPVVVDRDLRPDLDALFMSALAAANGRGGWPITATLDHSGRPFWLGTYLPVNQMVQTLDALADAWDAERGQVENAAGEWVKQIGAAAGVKPLASVPDLNIVNEGLGKIAASFDPEWGGFGREPKFPSPPHIQLMLRAAMATGGDQVKNIVTTTTDAMAAGGIYDQIGGGFHRLTTDREWLLPEFEKTLFDQAQLLSVYHDAFTLWGEPLHRRVTEETIAFTVTNLQRPDGGFSSGFDGASPGPDGSMTEGAFYTWTPREIRTVLQNARLGDEPVDPDIVLEWWDITDEGHIEGRSIPNRRHHRDDQLRSPELSAIRGGLVDIRRLRPQPAIHPAVITEHHGLMIRSLSGAANYFRRADWRASAEAAGEFLLGPLRNGAGWYRLWDAEGRGAATAGDYAAIIHAGIRLADSTGHLRWLKMATDAADFLLDHFFDPSDGALWSSQEDDPGLFFRFKPIDDRAVPAANAAAAEGLLKLAAITGEMRYRHQAERILQFLGGALSTRSTAMPSTLATLEMYHRGLLQILIVPEPEAIPDWGTEETSETGRLIRLLHNLWRPNFVTWWGTGLDSPLVDGRTEPGAYLCRDFETIETAKTAEDLYRLLTGRDLEPGQSLAV